MNKNNGQRKFPELEQRTIKDKREKLGVLNKKQNEKLTQNVSKY